MTGRGVRLINIFAAIAPPTNSQAQKQQLASPIPGIAERIPAITPPTSAGCFQSSSFINSYSPLLALITSRDWLTRLLQQPAFGFAKPETQSFNADTRPGVT